MANSAKDDRLATTESCALYYFPEIPNTAKPETGPAASDPFSSGPFDGNGDRKPQETGQQDEAQTRALVEEAFKKGLEQGRAEASAAQKERVADAVASLEASINELHRVRQHDLERMEVETVRLALGIAKKIIGYETEHHTVVQHVVRQAMEKVNDTRHLIIKLNPRDLDAVEALQQELMPADDLKAVFSIEADADIKRGGCVVETKLGDVDARIDRQIKIIEELLVDQLPKSGV